MKDSGRIYLIDIPFRDSRLVSDEYFPPFVTG